MKAGWRVRRFADGSTLLRKRIGRAFVPLDSGGEVRMVASGVRIGGGLLLGNGVLTAAHHSPVWMVGGTCAWAWAAWRAGDPKAAQPKAEDLPEGASDAQQDDGELIQADPEPAVLWDLIRRAAALTKQRTSAHLQAVLELGQIEGEFDGWDVSDLRELIEVTHGVPIVEKKKLTIGIGDHARDQTRMAVLLEHLPDAAPATAPLATTQQPVEAAA
ncbi:hypothetical protein TR51_06565 [Kitasatospora griseola]|uniref:Uncharacterized protein n=1 Tax=Kitasatospora griseola TaxID=2064 RepID=A0A0D0Q7E4_KITGR|nr:hypothetical protein [Kitasatospora griseola]KIQ67043.1 hypothetical protein TR51_06565 [Kitasatospora griseola]